MSIEQEQVALAKNTVQYYLSHIKMSSLFQPWHGNNHA